MDKNRLEIKNSGSGGVKTSRAFYKSLYVRRRILQTEINCVVNMVQGLASGTGKQKILMQIKNSVRAIASELGLDQREVNALWKSCYSMYANLAKKTYGLNRRSVWKEMGPEDKYETIYHYFRANIQKNGMIHNANQVMYLYENRKKWDKIDELLDKPNSPFFLASAHPMPAKDHAEYEGRLYYDADWEEKGEYSTAEKAAIRALIRNRKLDTVQYITQGPVWLCTRPNCKHYLMNMPLQEALHSSARSMLRKHGMYMQNEYPVDEKLIYYREYYNRAKIEETLMKYIPNKKLEQDLKKDKKLLDKWKDKLYNKNVSKKDMTLTDKYPQQFGVNL